MFSIIITLSFLFPVLGFVCSTQCSPNLSLHLLPGTLVTLTDPSKVKGFQRKFSALYYDSFEWYMRQ